MLGFLEHNKLDEATSVKSDKYSWGTMKTVHKGSDFSIPLHPEHHQAIHKLKHGESHSFTDETNAKWKATREGDKVHFHGTGAGNKGYKATVAHEHMKEEVEEVASHFDVSMLAEKVKTTHEDPLVTVHDKHGLHTHANLSTANKIFNTNVKHTDVHKGAVDTTDGWETKNKLKFAISKHHASAIKEAKDTVEKDAQGNVKSWKHEGDWKKTGASTTTDKSGAKHGPMSKVRHLARMALKKAVKEEVIVEEKHRVQVTVSDPNHSAVTQRDHKVQKFIRIGSDKAANNAAAVEAAKKHYKKMGWKVHGAEHVGMVKDFKEEVELDEAVSSDSKARYEYANGKKPSGNGQWMFSTVHPKEHDVEKHKDQTHTASGNFSDASKAAAKHFRDKGHKGEIHVLS